jgi:hypothetical protein
MLFRQKTDDTLSNVRIGDAFNDFNGLNRRNRVRYDTPTFYGFRLATSAISDERYDAAVYWGGQGYGFEAAGAASIADPNQDNTDFQYSGSFSLLHKDTGLNFLLLAVYLVAGCAGIEPYEPQTTGKKGRNRDFSAARMGSSSFLKRYRTGNEP